MQSESKSYHGRFNKESIKRYINKCKDMKRIWLRCFNPNVKDMQRQTTALHYFKHKNFF